MPDKILTEVQLYLETLQGTAAGSREIDEFLFPETSITDGEEVRVDEYLSYPTVMRVTRGGMPANPNPIDAGSAWTHTPPTHAEKFQVTAMMTGNTVAGVPSTNHGAHVSEMIERQARKLQEGWLAARRKASIGLLETGKLSFYDSTGTVFEEVDFGRKASQKFDYDFSTAGHTFDKAIASAYTKGRDYDMYAGDLALLCGKNWLARFDSDEAIQKKVLNNPSNILIEQAMEKAGLGGVEGLDVYARYHVAGMTKPIWILAYEPTLPFKATVGGNREPYIGDDKAIFFSLRSGGYKFYRGVDVNTGYNTRARVPGYRELDTYTLPDPTTQIIRLQSRFMYALHNVNHAVTITGKKL